MLYLENIAMPGVFTEASAELCSLFAAQAAIAIENARLLESACTSSGCGARRLAAQLMVPSWDEEKGPCPRIRLLKSSD